MLIGSKEWTHTQANTRTRIYIYLFVCMRTHDFVLLLNQLFFSALFLLLLLFLLLWP